MTSQPVKVGDRAIGRVELAPVPTGAYARPAWKAYVSRPDGAEELVGIFASGRGEANRLRAVAAVKQAAADWEGTPS